VLAPPRDIPQFSPDYYRPLTIATYLVDRAIGGERPSRFISPSCWRHALASLLFWALAAQCSATGPAPAIGALGAGLLFAVHRYTASRWRGPPPLRRPRDGVPARRAGGARAAPWSWGGSAASGAAAFASLAAKEAGVAALSAGSCCATC
jgi:hypothetical protein